MRRIAPWVVVLGSLLLWLPLCGCGIETFILLNPPSAFTYGGIGQFKFQATSENSESSFLGFEVYYRIFRNSESIPVSFETFDTLVAAGFRRMNRASDIPGNVDKPLVEPAAADIGTSYQVTIDFQDIVPELEYPTVRTDAAAPRIYKEVRRGVAASSVEFKNFYTDEFDTGDTDASAGAIEDIASGLSVTVVCFALSYGIDLSSGLEVYSQPVWLGNGTFTFPY